MANLFQVQLKNNKRIPDGGIILVVSKNFFKFTKKYLYLTKNHLLNKLFLNFSGEDIDDLNEGDIVKVFPDGRVYRLWNIKSIHNVLFVTGYCNFRCLMCPQPLEEDNEKLHKDNLTILKLLKKNKVELVAITGGEPLLYHNRIIEYFNIINKKFPKAKVDLLTNGSLLHDFKIAKELSLNAPYLTYFCVSLHGSVSEMAESINRKPLGWENAVRGILNLAKLRQFIEIRVVITQKNYLFLEEIALFIYRNFPFVTHVAFLGQEICGDARINYKDIWVEPLEYKEILKKAVCLLREKGMNVSIYNLPLCLLEKKIWSNARMSISDWKQNYNSKCQGCTQKNGCCGFFTTSESYIPQGIEPIK